MYKRSPTVEFKAAHIELEALRGPRSGPCGESRDEKNARLKNEARLEPNMKKQREANGRSACDVDGRTYSTRTNASGQSEILYLKLNYRQASSKISLS